MYCFAGVSTHTECPLQIGAGHRDARPPVSPLERRFMSETLPLAGINVIELGHSVAAPYAGEILGELGAEVFKVEKSEGDDARSWAPPYLGSMSAMFQS